MICRQISTFKLFKPSNSRNLAEKPEKKSADHVNLAYASFESTDSKKKAAPLIILHGLLGSKSNFSTICKSFQMKTKPNRKIIAVDARNHGDSPHHPSHDYEGMSLDLKVFLDSMDIRRASLLGHSMGGGTAMLFSLKNPETVEKLIVCDFSPISNKLGDLKQYLEVMDKMKLPKNLTTSAARAQAELKLQQYGIRHRSRRKFLTTNLVLNSDGSAGWRVNVPVLTNSCKDLSRLNIEEGKTFKGPTLFIGGTNSGYLRPRDASSIKKIFPNSRFKFIEGSGHWVHFDKRKEFIDICLSFLNENSGSV